jgi:hypothetical protein
VTDASEPTIKTLSSVTKSKPTKRAWVGMFVLVFCLIVTIVAGTLYAVHSCPWLGDWIHASTQQDSTATFARPEDMEALRQRLSVLESKLVPLELRFNHSDSDVPKTGGDAGASKDNQSIKNELTALAADLALTKTEMKTSTTAIAEARVAEHSLMAAMLTFEPLREAALSGHGFADELASFRAVAQGHVNAQESLAQLDPLAVTGVPTTAQLHDSLMERQSKIRHTIENAAAEHWWQRIGIELGALISVHPVKGDPAIESIANVTDRLTADDSNGAVDAFNKLPLPAQKDLTDWKQSLDARRTVDAVLHNVSKQLVTSIGSQP